MDDWCLNYGWLLEMLYWIIVKIKNEINKIWLYCDYVFLNKILDFVDCFRMFFFIKMSKDL